MATSMERMSIVDIIRKSMVEGFSCPKRKFDESELNETNNKKRHSEKNDVNIKHEPDYLIQTDDNYFQSFEGFLHIKEEPTDTASSDDTPEIENSMILIKEESLSPMPDEEEQEFQLESQPKIEVEPLEVCLQSKDSVESIDNESGVVFEVLTTQYQETDVIQNNGSVSSTEVQRMIPIQVIKNEETPTSSHKENYNENKVDINFSASEINIKKKEPIPTKPYELNITFLQALYLRCHEDGIAFVDELTSEYLADVKVESKGLIKISESRFKKKILKHLNKIKVISVPRKSQNLVSYLDVVLKELAKDCTVQNLKDLLHKLKLSDANKHAYYQTINMKIYGYFQWEFGLKFTNVLKDIATFTSDVVEKTMIASIEEALRYLIENERPIKLYGDIIESISSQKSNFLDSTLINSIITEDSIAKNKYTRKIIIDDLKYDYFINSLTSKFMITRWKSKLKVTIEEVGEDTFLLIEGSEVNVEAAHEEFRNQISEGPMLPFGTLQVFSFVTFLLDKIKTIQCNSDTFFANKALSAIMALEIEPPNVRRDRKITYIYEDLHTYIFATRGLQQGKEKLIVLHEFISNYKSSLLRDNLKQNEWKMVQDAFVVLQYKKCNRISNYRYFLKCLDSMKHTEAIILTLEEYKILSESVAGKSIIEVLGKLVEFDVTFSRIFSSKHATLTIIGSENGILTCKKKLYEFLDRVLISEADLVDLENKLNNALEKLWTPRITKEYALIILNRIEILTYRNEIYMVETLRELYMQLHVYLFGQCRFLNGQNHISRIRIYYHYIKSEKNSTLEILNDIISSYEIIFGKNKKQDINYKQLIDRSSNEMLDLNSRRDANTVCIYDSVVKAHFNNNRIAKNLTNSYIDETKLDKIAFVVQKFLNNKLIIFSSTAENGRKLPIIIKSESVRIFSQIRSKIQKDLTISLQAIAEVIENMTHTKATKILEEIKYLEKNSATNSLIEEKYQILNIYLFACCGSQGGYTQLDVLKSNHTKMVECKEEDNFITDKFVRASLVNAYEFIFWKGKKESVDYDFLLYKSGLIANNNIYTLPIPIEMFGYLTNVKEGIQFLENCPICVKIEVQQDFVNNACIVKIEGDYLEVQRVVDMLINEIKCINLYFDIPFKKTDLAAYLQNNLIKLFVFDSLEIPVHILLELEILERLIPMSETECLQILDLKGSFYNKLHKYIFGTFEKGKCVKHINTLREYTRELTKDNSNEYLDLNIIMSIYDIVHNYLFSRYKIPTLDYKKILKQCIRCDNKMNLHFTLSKHMSNYLNNNNDMTDATKLLKDHMDTITNTISVNAFGEHVDKLREYISEYSLILKKIPMKRVDLIKRIKTLFTRISDSKNRDPTTIWASLRLCKKLDSIFAVDRLPLSYSRLHTYLFGYRQLLDGKQLIQCLGQHEYNLEIIGKPEDIVSIQVLRDVYIALQYIEGNEDKGVDYKTLISKSRKRIVLNDSGINRVNTRLEIPTRTFIISSEVKAPPREREYLQNSGTGRALINSIQKSSVHIKFESEFLKLRGSDTEVKLATDKLTDYLLMVSTLPVHDKQLRCTIASYMRKLNANNVNMGHISSLYTEIFKIELQNIDSSRKVNKTLLNGHYHVLHINLFGSLRLLEGEKHVKFLKKFEEGNYYFNESNKRKLYEAYDYIFGSTKKDIDYSLIIRDLCGNKCFYVNKALTRLLQIQNRLKKKKDSFIGPSSISLMAKWIGTIKEDMFNDEIMVTVYKFLNKYEDVRDNKQDIILI